jgi:hypothetical protein
MGFEIWYENPYLQAVYQYGHTGVNPTTAESRISLLYSLWANKNTMPWQWDFEHYPEGKDDEMYGIFYPEDFNTCLQIAGFESDRKEKK